MTEIQPPRRSQRRQSTTRVDNERAKEKDVSRSGSKSTLKVVEEGEPSRGEEANLISVAWGSSDKKRSRRHSSANGILDKSEASSSKRPRLPHKNINSTHGFAPTASQIPRGPLAGMNGLAAAASFTASTSGNAPRYPHGLTPYRYACLMPLEPPPPPGDPFNPALRVYNPLHPDTSGTTIQAIQQIIQPDLDQDYSNILPQEYFDSLPIPMSTPLPTDTAESLSMLSDLNPSQPGRSSLAYPTSPGERSDGQSGSLTPKMMGRYTMGHKDDCEDCNTGAGGHWGHWMKSAPGWEGNP